MVFYMCIMLQCTLVILFNLQNKPVMEYKIVAEMLGLEVRLSCSYPSLNCDSVRGHESFPTTLCH